MIYIEKIYISYSPISPISPTSPFSPISPTSLGVMENRSVLPDRFRILGVGIWLCRGIREIGEVGEVERSQMF